jgi:acyl-[acyl carrier protein]--UDP-N-acetylglucosamine O-acyltransferase
VGSTIGHDCIISEACIISPNVNINGSVEVSAGAFFGSKTSVDPGVIIGKFSKMVSGSTVRADLKPGHLFLSDAKKSVKMFNTESGKSLFAGR